MSDQLQHDSLSVGRSSLVNALPLKSLQRIVLSPGDAELFTKYGRSLVYAYHK